MHGFADDRRFACVWVCCFCCFLEDSLSFKAPFIFICPSDVDKQSKHALKPIYVLAGMACGPWTGRAFFVRRIRMHHQDTLLPHRMNAFVLATCIVPPALPTGCLLLL